MNKKIFITVICMLMPAAPALAQVSKEDKFISSPEVPCTLEALPDPNAEPNTELAPFNCTGYGRISGASEAGIYTLKAGYFCNVSGWPVWHDTLTARCKPEFDKSVRRSK